MAVLNHSLHNEHDVVRSKLKFLYTRVMDRAFCPTAKMHDDTMGELNQILDENSEFKLNKRGVTTDYRVGGPGR